MRWGWGFGGGLSGLGRVSVEGRRGAKRAGSEDDIQRTWNLRLCWT